MTDYVTTSKESLIHKSLQNFPVPELFERYDYVDTSIKDLTAAHEIFKAFKNNPRIIDNIKYVKTPYILEKRKVTLNDIMKNNGFDAPFNSYSNTYFLSIESAVAHDNIEYLKENIEVVNAQNNQTYLISISCKFGAIKCFRFLRLNGAKYSIEAPESGIDSGNAEIIINLYNNGIDFSDYFQHAIFCRKHAIADWILENYSQVSISFNECLRSSNIRAACFCLENKIPFSLRNYQSLYDLNPTKAVRNYLLDHSSDKLVDELIDNYIQACDLHPYYGRGQ